jgi:hypothetical protein
MIKLVFISILAGSFLYQGPKKTTSIVEFNVNGKKFDYSKTTTHYAKLPMQENYTVGLTFESKSGSTLDLFIPETETQPKLPLVVDLGSKARGGFGMTWKSSIPYESLYTLLSGTLTIKKWDHKAHIISGIFDAKLKTDDPEKPKEITEGRFENVKY